MSELNPAPPETRILSVSQLNLEVQGLLEGSFPLLWVEAELSNLKRPASGHLYFSLKDDRAQVSGAMFRNRNRLLRFTPRDGMQVLVRARVTLYVPRGNYQLIIEHMEEAGEGRLRREFEALRERLFQEGLFAGERKRGLPRVPRRIGVITSPSGAAIRDILHVLKRRCPGIPVLVYPAAVQGNQAPAELRRALALANARDDCDVLIIGRGGGSLEDLWAFNDEQLTRDVAASRIPVVSAVGHEVDTALTDYAADLRAPTPSAAAELISPDTGDLRTRVKAAEQRLGLRMRERLASLAQRLDGLSRRLGRPDQRLQQYAQQLDELEQRLTRQLRHQQAMTAQRLEQLRRRLLGRDPRTQLAQTRRQLNALHQRLLRPVPRQLTERENLLRQLQQRLETAGPMATLRRGYSISFTGEEPLRSVKGVKKGDRLRTQLADGEIFSVVDNISDKPFGRGS